MVEVKGEDDVGDVMESIECRYRSVWPEMVGMVKIQDSGKERN